MKVSVTFILFITLFLFAFNPTNAQITFPISVQLQNKHGETVNSKQLLNEDKFVMIEFWHTGCIPCIQMLDAIRDHFEEWKTNTHCKVIAIASQDIDQRFLRLIEEKNWPVEIYLDPEYNLFRELSKLHNDKNINFSFPTAFIFDKNWNLIDKLSGAKRKRKETTLQNLDETATHDMYTIDLVYYYRLFANWSKKIKQ